MASEFTKVFTDQNFETEVLKAVEPVLVDFWAEWCPPCVMIGPVIDKLAKDYNGKVKIGKVDADSNRDLCIKYRVDNIPRIIIFKNGVPVISFVGPRSERDFRDAIDGVLSGK